MTSRPVVFVSRAISEQAVQRLAQAAQVEIWPEEAPPAYDEFLRRASQVDGLLTMLSDRIDAPLIEAASPRLKVIAQMAVGYDNIDVAAAKRLGVAVGHTPGVLTETTADLAFALLLAAARRVVEAHNEVQAGIWRAWGPSVLTGVDVYGATLGIIGLGRIGQAVARRAKGFGMRVLYHSQTRHPEREAELGVEWASLEELLRESDFVSLHTYLSPQTVHLLGRTQLAWMKPTAILVNTARGAVVDPAALAEALCEGRIAGAALDVTEPEPIPRDSPLLTMPNVVITPHIASASRATRERMAMMTVENIIAGLQGDPLPYQVK